VKAQGEVLGRVDESFSGLPQWRSVYRDAEPVGVADLARMALDVYGADDPLATPSDDGPFRVTRTRSGAVLHLAVPFVTREDIGLARNGDELVVSVASYRRLLTLPSGLARLTVAGARVEGGELQVRFAEGTEERAR
jgi:arsenite-transporting ATPase